MSTWIVGVDEAGRGPLAGPVVAAAVVLDPGQPVLGLADSKALTEKQRVAVFEAIKAQSVDWATGRAEVEEIDRLNILQATLLAMQRAVLALKITPGKVQIDGNQCPVLDVPMEAIVQGDKKVPEIAAASVVAKVVRDREMQQLAEQYPSYGFEQHKGYGTRQHLEAIRDFGLTPYHRRSFGPCKAVQDH